jgi:hypothetical protein
VWIPYQVQDISASGCRIVSALPARLGQRFIVRLGLNAPLRTERFPIIGTVVWTRQDGAQHHAGIQFSEDNQLRSARLHRLVREVQIHLISEMSRSTLRPAPKSRFE